MPDISYIDALILLPVLVGLVRGMMRGLISEVVAIIAIILGMVGARIVGPQFAQWLTTQFTWPEAVCRVVAYTLVFLGIAIICNMVGRLLSRLLRAIHLGWLNRIAGGAFGAVKYGLVVLAVVYMINLLDNQFQFIRPEVKQSSVCYNDAVHAADYLLTTAKQQIQE